jgi:hypothetical protein
MIITNNTGNMRNNNVGRKLVTGRVTINGADKEALFIEAKSSRSKRKDFVCISQQGLVILSKKELTGCALRTLLYLVSLYDFNREDCEVMLPTHAIISKDAGISIGSVCKSLKELKKNGCLQTYKEETTGRIACILPTFLISL